MRIAQVAPLAEAVPPKGYGGTERVVSYLTEELVKLGHEVTLFATGDSRTKATLVPISPRGARLNPGSPKGEVILASLLEEVANAAADFDVIHFHIEWLHLPLFQRLGGLFVTTLHNRLDAPGLSTLMRRFPRAAFVSISDHQRHPISGVHWLSTIPHGLPTQLFRATRRDEGYLAFLGRVAPEKGPEIAIRLACGAARPLRIAAKIPRSQQPFFREKIEPLIDNRDIRFLGEISETRKSEFLGGAAALLFPIDWPEPFGLVMIEAMACGTPVIAFRRGAVPEIIEHGVTGFIVDTEEEALESIKHLGDLSRETVRAEFERRFTAHRMAERYVRLYGALNIASQFAN
jgi:glycosyltransferase involved in cell wall biosynthesis